MRQRLFFSLLLGLAFSSVYDVGDIISESHQNITKSTCYSGNGYSSGESWKLADWDGASNGGNYNVIYINLSASW